MFVFLECLATHQDFGLVNDIIVLFDGLDVSGLSNSS